MVGRLRRKRWMWMERNRQADALLSAGQRGPIVGESRANTCTEGSNPSLSANLKIPRPLRASVLAMGLPTGL
jgi:hypothetical protein